MMTAKDVSQQLARRAEDIAQHLLPNGTKANNEWRAGSIRGEKGQSLGVHLTGDKAGLWCDFGNGEDKGDLLDLWAATRNITLREAISEASKWLGISQLKFVSSACNYVKPVLKNIAALTPLSQVMKYLIEERKLLPKVITAYKIGERGRDIVFPFWRNSELILVKYLSVDRAPDGKKKISVEKDCEPCLFGWHLIPSNGRSVAICEGEIDAMSLYQLGIAALSVPFGGGKGDKQKWIEYEYDRLSIFDVIFLCFDPDEEGKVAIVELVERLGRHRCRIVGLPYKDPNACLQAGMSKEEMQKCFDNARTLDPEELKNARQFVEEVIKEFYPVEGAMLGYNPPWEKARDKVLFRPDELSIWTGINGHGKSQFFWANYLSIYKTRCSCVHSKPGA